MKKFLLVSVMVITMAFVLVAPAFATPTREGPYGPSAEWIDYGTCQNPWATVTSNSTYVVSADFNNDGIYYVKLRVTGRFVTLAGASPGACATGTYDGSTVIAGVHGRIFFTFNLVVSGTFDPNASCDVTCSFDGYFDNYQPITNFVTAFFGSGATWRFSTKPTREVAKSGNTVLCARGWYTAFDDTGVTYASTGDIATYCP